MRTMKSLKKAVSFGMMLLMLLTMVFSFHGSNVSAASSKEETVTKNYITIGEFIKKLVTAMDLKVDKSVDLPYISKAYELEIIKDDFENFDKWITRTDTAVLLNRADEYLHGETLDNIYIENIMENRLSDIKRIDKAKREAVVCVYGKGIITGYSNGKYSQDREFRGNNYVLKGTAKKYIDLTLNPKKRAVLSRDGQLTRSTNLPKNADKFEYILASFPNEYYDSITFQFEQWNQWDPKTKKLKGSTERKDYWYPKDTWDMTFRTFTWECPLSEQLDLYLDQWVKKVRKYVTNIFNVNYKTIGDSWIQEVKDSCAKFNGATFEGLLGKYIDKMKKHKTIVQSSKVAVDQSSLYRSTDGWYIRAYVKFKVEANEIPEEMDELIYSKCTYINKLKLNEWQTGIFDVCLSPDNGYNGDGESIGVELGSLLIY